MNHGMMGHMKGMKGSMHDSKVSIIRKGIIDVAAIDENKASENRTNEPLNILKTRYARGEIDYIEKCNGKLEGYEVKWSPNVKVKKQYKFLDSYEQSTFKVITRENYLDFVS